MPSNEETEDKRDTETKLSQDLGLQEWQIRDIMPIIEADRRKVLEEVLAEGPKDDIEEHPEYSFSGEAAAAINETNAQWRSIIKRKMEE